MAYYALICAVLALVSPWLARAIVRFIVGLGVGLFAAGLLPALRAWIGV